MGGGGGLWGAIIRDNCHLSFAFQRTPRISLSCKLVPVRYRECQYGLFSLSLELFLSQLKQSLQV